MKGQMDVREAVKKAKEGIVKIFEDEDIRDPRLEEVRFTLGPDTWKVTISFVRSSFMAAMGGDRTFKVVHVDDLSGEIRSITHRTLPTSN